MSWTNYEKLGERCYTRRLENGLTVKVVPKKDFSRKLAYFVTDFGAIHRDFRLDGEDYHVPAGVAHFLEHKLFELPDRDVTAEFAALGANVNAFTGFDMTAYYFSCTANFRENLRLLLEFVSTPYFTKESVEREYGIIDQEIAMNEDSPDSREFELLAKLMYRNHPIRTPILGTRQSIRQITPEILYLCHRAFYAPENMILCVVGDVDAEEVVEIAREILGENCPRAAEKRRNWDEEMVCQAGEDALAMEVVVPSFQLGFKCEPPTREDQLWVDAVGYFAAEMLFGESSSLYLELYEKGLIDSSFGGAFDTIDGCAMLSCGCEGENGEKIREALLDKSAFLVENGIDQQELLRLKRGVMGRRLRDMDSFDALCFRICAYHIVGQDYFRFPGVYESVTGEQIREFLSRVVRPERCALAKIVPASTKEEA